MSCWFRKGPYYGDCLPIGDDYFDEEDGEYMLFYSHSIYNRILCLFVNGVGVIGVEGFFIGCFDIGLCFISVWSLFIILWLELEWLRVFLFSLWIMMILWLYDDDYDDNDDDDSDGNENSILNFKYFKLFKE